VCELESSNKKLNETNTELNTKLTRLTKCYGEDRDRNRKLFKQIEQNSEKLETLGTMLDSIDNDPPKTLKSKPKPKLKKSREKILYKSDDSDNNSDDNCCLSDDIDDIYKSIK
jgi:hypothetical protein